MRLAAIVAVLLAFLASGAAAPVSAQQSLVRDQASSQTVTPEAARMPDPLPRSTADVNLKQLLAVGSGIVGGSIISRWFIGRAGFVTVVGMVMGGLIGNALYLESVWPFD